MIFSLIYLRSNNFSSSRYLAVKLSSSMLWEVWPIYELIYRVIFLLFILECLYAVTINTKIKIKDIDKKSSRWTLSKDSQEYEEKNGNIFIKNISIFNVVQSLVQILGVNNNL